MIKYLFKKTTSLIIVMSFVFAQIAYPQTQEAINLNPETKTASGMSVERTVAAQQNAVSMVETKNAILASAGAIITVNNVNDLQQISSNPSAHYVLGGNIDASDTRNWNGGLGFDPIDNFSGIFDGQGYAISNLYINRPTEDYVGLFGSIGTGSLQASVSNTCLTQEAIIGHSFVGGLAGFINNNNGSITGSYATGLITGTMIFGGLIGSTATYDVKNITNSYSTNIYNALDLQLMEYRLNGTFALMNDMDAGVTHMWNAGAGFDPIGGNPINDQISFTGTFNGNNHTISNLIINRPSEQFVGLFGDIKDSTISDVGLVGGTIAGKNYVGGLVGHSDSGTIEDCFNTGNVSGGQGVGGLEGYSTYGNVINSYTTGNVSGNSYVGGIEGYKMYGDIINSYATGSVNGYEKVGGLAGRVSYGNIKNSYARGNVKGSTGSIGGLMGDGYQYNVANSYATGSVTGSYDTGGLVGLCSDAYTYVTNSYATGAVSGTNSIGGLIGKSSYATIATSYATGKVTGSTSGGLLGSSYLSTITNCYWNTTTTGKTKSAGGGTGKTTAQMMNQSTYTGWDFSVAGDGTIGNWIMAGTPHLQMEHTTAIDDAVDLQLMAVDLKATYTLAKDFDVSVTKTWNGGAGFSPIGDTLHPFTGTLNGQNKTISNLYINRPTLTYIGLFGYTNGNINQVKLLSSSINGYSIVGAFAGYNGGNITSVSANCTVTGTTWTGGLIGLNYGKIMNSTSSVLLRGYSYVGGVVGGNWGIIYKCLMFGSILGAHTYMGKLVGYNKGTVIY